MHDRACPTCSGATDVPDGKGGIAPCPECQLGVLSGHRDEFSYLDGVAFLGRPELTVSRVVTAHIANPRAILENIAATDPDRADDARARLNCLWDDLN